MRYSLIATVCLLVFASPRASIADDIPALLVQLDSAAERQDVAVVQESLVKWKQLEPNSASPWLKEAAIAWFTPNTTSGDVLSVLRKAQKALPDNATLRARLAAWCQLHGRPQEGLMHYRWLLEKTEAPLAKLSWILQMRGSNTANTKELQAWLHWKNKQEPENYLWQAGTRLNADASGKLARALEAGNLPLGANLVVMQQMLYLNAPNEAAIHLRRLHSQQPHRWHQLQLVRACIYAGHHKEANEILDEVSMKPDLSNTETETVAQLYLEQCLWGKVREFLSPKWAAQPQNYRYAYLIGCAAEELRDLPGAQEVFLKLLHIRQDTLPAEAPCLASFYLSHEYPFQWPSAFVETKGKSASTWIERFCQDSPWGAYNFIHRHNADYGYVQHEPICRYSPASRLVPSTLEEAQRHSLIHLAALWAELPPEQRTVIAKSLKEANVPDAARLMHFYAPGRPEIDSGYRSTGFNQTPLTVNGKSVEGGGMLWDEDAYVFHREKSPEIARKFALRLGGVAGRESEFAAAVKAELTELNKPWSPPVKETGRERDLIEEDTRAFPETPPDVEVAEIKESDRTAWGVSSAFELPFSEENPRSPEHWEIARRLIVNNVQLGLAQFDWKPMGPKQREFVESQVGLLPVNTPRAVVEKASAYLVLEKPDLAWSVFEKAIQEAADPFTLQSCGMHLFWHTPLRQKALATWGPLPAVGQTRMFYHEKVSEQEVEMFAQYFENLPEWQLLTKSHAWGTQFYKDAASDESKPSPAQSRFLKATLRIPTLARRALPQFFYAHGGLTPEDRLEAAKIAYYAEATHAVPDTLGIEAPHPAVSEILARGKLATLEQLILKLRKSPQTSAQIAADDLTTLADLYFGDEVEFPAVARRALLRRPLMRGIDDIAAKRKIIYRTEYDLLENYTAYATVAGGDVPGPARESTSPQVQAIAADFHLGPKTDRATLLWRRNPALWQPWLEQFAGESLPVFVEDFIGPLPKELRPWAWGQYINAAKGTKHRTDVTAALLLSLQDLNWLGSAATCDPVPLEGVKNGSALGLFLRGIQSGQLRFLESAWPHTPTFGYRLIKAAREGDLSGCLLFLEDSTKQIAACPEPQRTRLQNLREELRGYSQ